MMMIQIQRVKPTVIHGGFHVQNRFSCKVTTEDQFQRLNSIAEQLAIMSSRDIVAGQNKPSVIQQLFELASDCGIHAGAIPDGPYQIRYLRNTNNTIIVGVEFLD